MMWVFIIRNTVLYSLSSNTTHFIRFFFPSTLRHPDCKHRQPIFIFLAFTFHPTCADHILISINHQQPLPSKYHS